MNRHFFKCLLCMILMCFFLAGCTTKPTEPTISINTERDQITYNFASVTRDTVTCTGRIACDYHENASQDISFTTGGKRVDKVYVSEGDYVKKGDVLVELSYGTLKDDIETLEYRIQRNKLKLGYLDEYELIDIQQRWVSYLFYTGQSLVDYTNTQDSVKYLQKNYDKQRESINDQIEFDELELAAKKKEVKESRIYASMDGKVTSIKSGLSGSTSKNGEVIMKIIDSSEGYFQSSSPELVYAIKEGEIYSISVSYGVNSGVYDITPYNMNEWGETQKFKIVGGNDTGNIEVGARGYIKLNTKTAENVLTLPIGTVYSAGDKYFVYIVNEQNMREVKWVETGLWGDELVEITGGLNEGDKVVKK